MKIATVLLVLLLTAIPSRAAILAKAGLSGGAFRISAALDHKTGERLATVFEIGHGNGPSYSLTTLGVSMNTPVIHNIFAGIGANYSNYSAPVDLPVGGKIGEPSGVGIGAFLKAELRDTIFIQAGYDTRLGGIAEAGYRVRK